MSGFSCDCINQMEAKLAEKNTKLVVTIAFPNDGTPIYHLPKIATEKIEPRKRRGPVLAIPTFCPFCGVCRGDAAAPVTAAEADARRYRFLRDHHVRTWVSNMGGPDTLDLDFEGAGHDLDAAIDAAMAEGRS